LKLNFYKLQKQHKDKSPEVRQRATATRLLALGQKPAEESQSNHDGFLDVSFYFYYAHDQYLSTDSNQRLKSMSTSHAEAHHPNL
jgi:hypothetical protein